MSYVHRYLPAEGCWTVGHHDSGEWYPVSDHGSEQAAADEAARLNGCRPPRVDCATRLRRLLGTELGVRDLDRLSTAELRVLCHLLEHWQHLAEARMERRQQREATTT